MSATFDCCCYWQLLGPDPGELHEAVAAAGSFLDRRTDVLLSDFQRDDELETLSITLEAGSRAAARQVLEQIAARIEKAVGTGSLHRELLELEDAFEVPSEW